MKTMDLRELDNSIAQEIFGINLKAISDADIGEAIMSAFKGNNPKADGTNVFSFAFQANTHKEWDLSCSGSKMGYGGASGNNGYGLWFWHERFGKPYQEDIEQHVLNWRRPVMNYSSEIALAWTVAEKVKLFDHYTIVKAEFDGNNGWWVFPSHTFYLQRDMQDVKEICIKASPTLVYAMGKTFTEAICRMALVMKAIKNEQTSRTDQFRYCGLQKACS